MFARVLTKLDDRLGAEEPNFIDLNFTKLHSLNLGIASWWKEIDSNVLYLPILQTKNNKNN